MNRDDAHPQARRIRGRRDVEQVRAARGARLRVFEDKGEDAEDLGTQPGVRVVLGFGTRSVTWRRLTIFGVQLGHERQHLLAQTRIDLHRRLPERGGHRGAVARIES
jgi:hypothetical protein